MLEPADVRTMEMTTVFFADFLEVQQTPQSKTLET